MIRGGAFYDQAGHAASARRRPLAPALPNILRCKGILSIAGELEQFVFQRSTGRWTGPGRRVDSGPASWSSSAVNLMPTSSGTG